MGLINQLVNIFLTNYALIQDVLIKNLPVYTMYRVFMRALSLDFITHTKYSCI